MKMSPFETIRQQALAMSPVERAALIEDLFESFDPVTRASVDEAWATEAEARAAALDEGKLGTVSFEDIQDEINRLK